jgi:hypothetical protein
MVAIRDREFIKSRKQFYNFLPLDADAICIHNDFSFRNMQANMQPEYLAISFSVAAE